VLLDAADRAPSPWLGTWIILATATGARNGELCGLEGSDLDAGTVRFRQALTFIDPAVLTDETDGDGGAGLGGRRKELTVGPLKSAASNAILALPPFSVQALRRHRRQQHRLRLTLGQPATVALRWVQPGHPPRPVQLDLVFRTERARRSTPTTPAAPSPTWPPAPGWTPTRTCYAMPGVRDGSQQRTGQHHRRPTSPRRRRRARPTGVHSPAAPDRARLAGVIEGVFGPEARAGRAVSAGRRAEGKWRESQPSSPT
jgi:hypothetical protein